MNQRLTILILLFLLGSTLLSCLSDRDACHQRADQVNQIDYCPLYLLLASQPSSDRSDVAFDNMVLLICARDRMTRSNCDSKSSVPLPLNY